ncbi:radical SAM/SPASM domain-containing protein [Methanoregula sp.]|uniref:radical SAM/SPASM domain-containing protein n=1 Tax=Methanoregula sp. TaxID=2052170 RepID=UPI003C795B75
MSETKNPGRGQDYRRRFDATISAVLHQGLRIIHADPGLFLAGTRIAYHQKKAAAIRKEHEDRGLVVPPVMITSITSQCNLACGGCYMKHRGATEHPGEMSPETLASLAGQAAELGVSVIVIAGGEPLVRKDEIFQLAGAFPEILFPVFTNGLMIDAGVADAIAGCRNIVPVISFEGFRAETDGRRGTGVYDRLLSICGYLRDRKIFFGCSITITRENFDCVTGETFIRQMIGAGARVFTFVEYVPIEPGTDELALAGEQKIMLNSLMSVFGSKFAAIFIGFPGDEEAFGGCLAAGRGFVHVSPSGDLEPCPAAPLSDANLVHVPLADALRSRLLSRIRDEHGLLTESTGGCALRANRVLVQQVLSGRK